MSTNTRIALLISLMVNAVLFGIGATVVLSVPVFNAHAIALLPTVIVASLLLTPLASWLIAPHMRSYRWQLEHQEIRPVRRRRN